MRNDVLKFFALLQFGGVHAFTFFSMNRSEIALTILRMPNCRVIVLSQCSHEDHRSRVLFWNLNRTRVIADCIITRLLKVKEVLDFPSSFAICVYCFA